MTSVGFFDTAPQAEESHSHRRQLAARAEARDPALPNPPKITGGDVVIHETSELVKA